MSSWSACAPTRCARRWADREIFASLQEELGVGNNGTTADGTFTLEHAECLAACDYAPVVTVNYEFFDNQTVEKARHLVGELRRGERPMPTRGAPLCTFKQIERQIAGFHDEAALALDSTSGGGPTEIGVKLAIERGDTAPSYAVDDQPKSAKSAKNGKSAKKEQPSANDAPLKTSGSDKSHPAKPGGEEAT